MLKRGDMVEVIRHVQRGDNVIGAIGTILDNLHTPIIGWGDRWLVNFPFSINKWAGDVGATGPTELCLFTIELRKIEPDERAFKEFMTKLETLPKYVEPVKSPMKV